MRKIITWIFIVTVSLTVLACTSSSQRLNTNRLDSSLPKNIGIQGYSAVSYFEDNSAQRGVADHNFTYKDKIYYFTSEQQIETFKENPKKYLPKYGQYCPYSLALGRRVGIDPTNFRIHNDELLLFHDDVELSTIDIPSQNNILDKADEQSRILLLNF